MQDTGEHPVQHHPHPTALLHDLSHARPEPDVEIAGQPLCVGRVAVTDGVQLRAEDVVEHEEQLRHRDPVASREP